MTRQEIDSTTKTEKQISLSNHLDNPAESNLTNLTREQIFKALHSLKPKDQVDETNMTKNKRSLIRSTSYIFWPSKEIKSQNSHYCSPINSTNENQIKESKDTLSIEYRLLILALQLKDKSFHKKQIVHKL